MLRALRFNSTAVRSIRRFSDAKQQRSRYQREQLLQRVYGHQCSDGELEAIVRGFGSKEVPQMSTNEMTDFDLVLWQRGSDLQAWRDDSSKIPDYLKGNVTLLTFLQYYRYWCSDTGKEYR